MTSCRVAEDSLPTQTLDTQQALVEQDRAIIRTDAAVVEADELNVIYCHVAAPLDGLVGLRLVDEGNMVHASDASGLLVINQVQPINVVFTLAEDDLPPLLKQLNAGVTLQVDAYDRAMKQKLAGGSLLSVDNQIDTATGTVKLKATFPNTDNALFPNQFVNARLLIETRRGVTLVPPAAIQRTGDKPFVYVVKPDPKAPPADPAPPVDPANPPEKAHGGQGGHRGPAQMVTVQPVTVGATDATSAEIVEGLAPGDLVVIDGVDRLQNESSVSVQMKK